MFITITRRRLVRIRVFCTAMMFALGFSLPFARTPEFYLRGTINVAVTESTESVILDISRQFAQRYPFVMINLVKSTPESMYQGLTNGKLDIGIVYEHELILRDSVEHSYLGTRVFVVGVDYFDPVYSLTLDDLRNWLLSAVSNRQNVWVVMQISRSDVHVLGDILGLPKEGFASTVSRQSDSGQRLYLMPIEELTAGIRVVPVNGISPLDSLDDLETYPLVGDVYAATSVPDKFLGKLLGTLGFYRRLLVRTFLEHTEDSYLGSLPLRDTTVELAAVGDVMLSRRVGEKLQEAGHAYVFDPTQAVLVGADIVFCNLESPITDAGRRLNMFRATPSSVRTLQHGSIDIVSLANNHVLDYDDMGLMRTMDNLSNVGIKYVGAGANIGEARREVIIQAKGMTIAFLAYTELWFMWTKTGRAWEAGESAPGVSPARDEWIVTDVQRAMQMADIVVVSLHWGKEYSRSITDTQRHLARLAVDAGASIVLGHHPHVLQEVEFYDDGVICYSMGNYVFDLPYPETKFTGIFEFKIWSGKVVSFNFIPCYSKEYVPELVVGELAETGEKLKKISPEKVIP